jgi:hypothetical protein
MSTPSPWERCRTMPPIMMVTRWPLTLHRSLCSIRSLAGSSGKLVTYADDPFTHAKTEFAFDVFQAARGHYASAAYKSFIGFEVAKARASSGLSKIPTE